MNDRHPAEGREPGPGVAANGRQARGSGYPGSGPGSRSDPAGSTITDAIRSAMNRRA
ncbi:hypothetical protein ATK36_1750 [Amycolatopsis sulphurea]|uniref:Uncharacterized protein n=1 Tax=Amycolatopsis sulphurea TaxID=76022 RepID=A0A2A9F5Z2_9PSEU|nr:hypothetical protein [Amycolatopsis sulphurea]PFG46754.1 hypothetical protein ATK36_1750 [Amycolatopsis sulphurea]